MRTEEYRVELTDEERTALLVLVRRGTAAARTLTRARVLLAAGEDAHDATTAAALHVSTKTVERVRHRFAQAPPDDRLRWALDELPRPGAAPKLDAKAEATLVALACTAPPDPRPVWTMQLLADTLVELEIIDAISETVRRTLGEKSAQGVAAAAPVPAHRGRRVRHPDGSAPAEDVLDLYAAPPDPERPLVCFDETPVQLLRDVRPPEPCAPGCAPGRAAREEYEYTREGTCNVFLSCT